jgi:Holliday junction resolvase YEN1
LAKRLIELFRFPWHAAPGEAEAECAMLQTEGLVDAVMSDDVDTVMFGSTVTMRNFSRDSSSRTGAASHVNVCRTADTADGEANVPLDRGGMILFAMLSGGDYLPAGVPRCGPKLAAEIAKAGFGTDLLEMIREDARDQDKKISDWRERLRHELQTNENGYFRNRHKAVQIPDSFPDKQILWDYVCPVTSSRAELKKKCGSWVWDQDIDVYELRSFICQELNWNYTLGAKRLIRTIAPQLVAQRLRLGCPVALDSENNGLQILRQRENFSLDGMSELKVQFIPADVVGLDFGPESSEQNEQPDAEEADPEANQVEDEDGTSRTRVYAPYYPHQPDSAWILESIVRLGQPNLVAAWHAEQLKKAAAKSRSPKKPPTPRKRQPKVLDPSMAPGAILRFGTIVKGTAQRDVGSSKPFSRNLPVPSDSSRPSVLPDRHGKDTEPIATKENVTIGRSDPPSSSIQEGFFDSDYGEEGILPSSPLARKSRDPNQFHSARSPDGLESSTTKPRPSPTKASRSNRLSKRVPPCDVGEQTSSPARKPRDPDQFHSARALDEREASTTTPRVSPTKVSRSNCSSHSKPSCYADEQTGNKKQSTIATSSRSSRPTLTLSIESGNDSDALPSPSTLWKHISKRDKPVSKEAVVSTSLPLSPSSEKDNLHPSEDYQNQITSLDGCGSDIEGPACELPSTIVSNDHERAGTQTKRRTSKIIEIQDGSWDFVKITDDDDGVAHKTSKSPSKNSPRKPRRLARVSILDLT